MSKEYSNLTSRDWQVYLALSEPQTRDGLVRKTNIPISVIGGSLAKLVKLGLVDFHPATGEDPLRYTRISEVGPDWERRGAQLAAQPPTRRPAHHSQTRATLSVPPTSEGRENGVRKMDSAVKAEEIPDGCGTLGCLAIIALAMVLMLMLFDCSGSSERSPERKTTSRISVEECQALRILALTNDLPERERSKALARYEAYCE